MLLCIPRFCNYKAADSGCSFRGTFPSRLATIYILQRMGLSESKPILEFEYVSSPYDLNFAY